MEITAKLLDKKGLEANEKALNAVADYAKVSDLIARTRKALGKTDTTLIVTNATATTKISVQ